MDVLNRVPVREQEPAVRAKNFEEVCYGYNEEEAMAEAARCIGCKNAQCVKGFLIGRPAHFGEEMFGIDHRQALSSLLREFNVPIIMDLDIGHMSPMMPVVCGSMADVSFDGSNFTISYDIEQ